MLSTFFSTSKPIHYLMVFIMVVIAVSSSFLWRVDFQWWQLSGILLLSASIAIYQFIISKNELTVSSSYALWITAVLMLMSLTINVSIRVLIALILILLALRRLLNLKTGRSAIRKIFDATFWITIATIFYQWSVLFYLVVFVSIFLYVRNDYKNWVAPFISIGCVLILLFTYDYVWDNSILNQLWISYKVDYLWNYSSFQRLDVFTFILLSINVLGSIVSIFKFRDIQQSVRPRFVIITFTGFCAIMIATFHFASFSSGGFLFFIPALSVLLARFAHSIQHKIVTELVLWIPVILLIISFTIR